MQKFSESAQRSLRALPELAVHCSILQASTGQFRQFLIDQPAVILVRHGWKRVLTEQAEVTARPGEAIFLPQGLECTVINGTGETGAYHSDAYALAPGLVARYADPSIKPTGEPTLLDPEQGLLGALDRAGQTIAQGAKTDSSVHRHILGELVIRLQALGIGLLPDSRESLALRIRTLVRTDLAGAWPAGTVAQAVGMSEPTLRRKLALIGTSLSDIIADVRMTAALGLLQATELPINRIALDVGYESASKFAARFRARFGLSPRDIRVPADERSGADFERPRAAAE